MSKAMDLSIPFTSFTVSTCQCAKCPVEKDSKCAREQWSKVGKTVCDTNPLKREEIAAASDHDQLHQKAICLFFSSVR